MKHVLWGEILDLFRQKFVPASDTLNTAEVQRRSCIFIYSVIKKESVDVSNVKVPSLAKHSKDIL
jgi:predicted CDP-diglyceride synthetase/phosphatidate cytidylyltransferase